MSDTGDWRRRKRLILDQIKLRKAQKILGAKIEAEAIDLALDSVIAEDERNRRARAAHDRFLWTAVREGLKIHDAFSHLDDERGRRRELS